MNEKLVKICPACRTKNAAHEIMCMKCGADLSSINVAENDNEKMENGTTETENRKTIIESEHLQFKRVFSEELSSKRKTKHELYPRTKDDEEAEKIIADMRKKAVETVNGIKESFADVIRKLKKR